MHGRDHAGAGSSARPPTASAPPQGAHLHQQVVGQPAPPDADARKAHDRMTIIISDVRNQRTDHMSDSRLAARGPIPLSCASFGRAESAQRILNESLQRWVVNRKLPAHAAYTTSCRSKTD